MDLSYSSGAGRDVPRKTIAVALRRGKQQATGLEEVRPFGTRTRDIRELSDWLAGRGVTHVARAATGVVGKPIGNLLEGRFTRLRVNPHAVKQGPGRKSDVRDGQGRAPLWHGGRRRSSFVPPRPRRELRDRTRQRAPLTEEHPRVAHRLPKTLADANLQLGAVATNILGQSGRAMRRALLRGERAPARLAERAEGRWRGKIPLRKQALPGHFRAPPLLDREPAGPPGVPGAGDRPLPQTHRGGARG